jgi:sigma-B regulation protein RsbU (phosphoserine phosphatase)
LPNAVTSDAGASPAPPPIFRTLPGRLVVLSGLLLLLIVVAQQFVALPAIIETFRRVVSIAFIVGSLGLLVLAVTRTRRQFLWRVRRKLILSYVLLGLVPLLLVVLFALAGSVVLYTNFAAYLFHEGIGDLIDDVTQIAETTAAEMTRRPDSSADALERKYEGLAARYPGLSLAMLPVTMEGEAGTPLPVTMLTAGSWRHEPAPPDVPDWLRDRGRFSGTLISRPGTRGDDEPHLLIRAAAPTPDGRRIIIADLPVDIDVEGLLHESTGTRIRGVAPAGDEGAASGATSRAPQGRALFSRAVALMDYTDWPTGVTRRVGVGLEAPVAALYDRLLSVQPAPLTPQGGFLIVLVVLAFMFLVVQGSALILGALLARQITSAVHQLFTGTERVRSGDFAHRIPIESRDQLGDLADSFNRMSGSIEHLLHVQREKQRLDDELRIAREIQKSLLPTRPPATAGISVADLCEPAREVGGDYYDFFELGPQQLGLLVADVSGKGTSAALYMAELKGLMLALSHLQRSPRQLLIDVNHRLSAHLDNRSFITMIYAVIDLEAGTLTSARAGHTPLIFVHGGRSEVVVSDGMVLGLRLPGAETRFAEILCEDTRPIGPGDVVVLYTDGVTEAMDEAGELFGDAALARVVSAQHELDPAGIRERVLREVRAFVGDAEPHDDMTMIILKVGEVQMVGRPA